MCYNVAQRAAATCMAAFMDQRLNVNAFGFDTWSPAIGAITTNSRVRTNVLSVEAGYLQCYDQLQFASFLTSYDVCILCVFLLGLCGVAELDSLMVEEVLLTKWMPRRDMIKRM